MRKRENWRRIRRYKERKKRNEEKENEQKKKRKKKYINLTPNHEIQTEEKKEKQEA